VDCESCDGKGVHPKAADLLRAVASLVERAERAERDLNAVGHALGICYDHDHGCGGHGPVEEMVRAAEEGCRAQGEAIDERERAEVAESRLANAERERDALADSIRRCACGLVALRWASESVTTGIGFNHSGAGCADAAATLSPKAPSRRGRTPRRAPRTRRRAMGDELRMDAYYYGFKPTGVPAIDRILSAVACAGKAYHHTESWSDDDCSYTPEGHTGRTPVAWIQNAANDAANALRASRPPPATADEPPVPAPRPDATGGGWDYAAALAGRVEHFIELFGDCECEGEGSEKYECAKCQGESELEEYRAALRDGGAGSTARCNGRCRVCGPTVYAWPAGSDGWRCEKCGGTLATTRDLTGGAGSTDAAGGKGEGGKS
jgi:hypothetical protein